MRFTNNGIAVPSQDTHLGPWVEQANKLCHDPKVEVFAKTYLKPGDWVVDGGCNIGDHTIAYCEAVGLEGKVLAFDPNPEVLACCAINCRAASCFGVALWSDFGMLQFNIVDGNVGSSHVWEHGQTKVMACPLDALKLQRLNLLKLDIEGSEYEALAGAIETIKRCKPIIFIEVNPGCLGRLRSNYQSILELIVPTGYKTELFDQSQGFELLQTDVVFFPI